MRQLRWHRRAFALVSVFLLVVAACGDDDEPAGGSAVFAAEQWPECLNPIQACAGAKWLFFSVTVHVGARLMELDVNGSFVPSPVLVEAPSVANGGVVENADGTFTLTFKIREDAAWSDGTPITSADIEFTKDAYLNTTGSLNTAGYDLITNVDTSDSKVAVLTFSEPYAPWSDLFGGGTNFLLPVHGFASTDIANDWLEEVPISGGPWVLESWSDQEAVLVPNFNYWEQDRIPLLDRVVFVPREDTDSEVAALETGEVQAAFPQPFPGMKDRLTGDIEFVAGGGVILEGLWPNQRGPNSGDLLSSEAVRKALIFSLDRQLIANTALGGVYAGDVPLLNCGGWVPTVGEWCDQTDFEQYVQDFAMVTSILTADGWTRPEGQECWEKGGRELRIAWNTVAGNERREDVQRLVSQMTAPIGLCFDIQNYDASELFENRLPTLTFDMGLYAHVTSPDPSAVAIFDIDGIPTDSNAFRGQNYTAWDNHPDAQTLSDLAFEADRTIDPVRRLEIIHQAGDIVAEHVVWIPFYQLPNIVAWRSDLLQGDTIGDWAGSTYGGFADMYDWSRAR